MNEKEAKTNEFSGNLSVPSLSFDFIKSNLFRTIHVDGVAGSITPGLDIYMVLFNERQPLPRQTTHLLRSSGELGEEISELRDCREAIIREMEVGAVIDIETAEAIVGWLSDAVETAKKFKESQQKEV